VFVEHRSSKIIDIALFNVFLIKKIIKSFFI
jgi:hypothetical protein